MALSWSEGFEQYPSDSDYGFVSASAIRDTKSLVNERFIVEHTIIQSAGYDYTAQHKIGACSIVGFFTEATKGDVPCISGCLWYAMDSMVLYYATGSVFLPLDAKGHSAYQLNMTAALAHFSATASTDPLYIPITPANSFEGTIYSVTLPWITGLPIAQTAYWVGGTWANTAIMSFGVHGGHASQGAVTGMGIGGVQHDDAMMGQTYIWNTGKLEPSDMNIISTSTSVSVPNATTATIGLQRRSLYPAFSGNTHTSPFAVRFLIPHILSTFTGEPIDYIPKFDIVAWTYGAQTITAAFYYMGT